MTVEASCCRQGMVRVDITHLSVSLRGGIDA